MGHSIRYQGDTINTDAMLDAREQGTLALVEWIESLSVRVALPWDNVDCHLATVRLRAARQELEQRVPIAARGGGICDPRSATYDDWRRLTQEVRTRVDIVEVFDRAGYQLHDGDPREAHAACLVCGGEDRLVIRRDPPGGVWCRQCGYAADVFAVQMSLAEQSFLEAVRDLAVWLGLPVPDEQPLVRAVLSATATDRPFSPRRLRVREVRRAGA